MSHAAARPAPLAALDPGEWPEEVPVLIVGGGPVGLSSAVLLAQRGIEVLLIDRRTPQARFPRAHLLNVRTMEVFHEMGVADAIYAQAPDDGWRKVVWYTSVAGPTPLHGLKLGEVHAWGGGPDAHRYAQASPRRFTNLPQIRLDPLLWAHAQAWCPGRIRAQQELTGIEQLPGVTAVVAFNTVTDEALRAVNIAAARGIALVDGDDQSNIHTALAAQGRNPDLRIVLRMFNQRLGEQIEKLLRNCTALSGSATAASAFANAALQRPNSVQVGGEFLCVTYEQQVPQDHLCVAADRIDPHTPKGRMCAMACRQVGELDSAAVAPLYPHGHRRLTVAAPARSSNRRW